MTVHTPLYQHTQPGTLVVWMLGVAALVAGVITAIAAVEGSGGAWVGAVTCALLLVTLWLFRSLTVRVTADDVVVWFGTGLIRRSFRTREIDEAHLVRNAWYYGWGVRLTPHGWLWNVSGFDAVELRLGRGRRFRIGTDDPAGLAAAIRQATGQGQ